MKKFKNTGKFFGVDLLPFSFILMLLILWEAVTRLNLVSPLVLPSLSSIIIALVTTFDLMWPHITATVYQAMVGFFVAIILSIIIATAMDSISFVKRTLYPLIITSQTVPIVTIAPLFAIWFGFGSLPKIIIVILVCFFPITISLLEGFASVDKDIVNLLKSMGAGKLELYKLVKFPAALPSFFSGLKISGTYSIMGSVIGEWVGGNRGLGRYMMRVQQAFATDRVFAAIVVIVILSISVLKIIGYLEKKSMPWNQDIQKTN